MGDALRELLGKDAAGSPLDVFADLSTEGIFVVDAQRTVVLFNRRAEELTGMSAEDVVGKPCVTGFRCAKCLEACHVFDGKVATDGVTIFRKDGTPIRVRKAGAVLRNSAGEVVGAMEVFSEAPAVKGQVSPEEIQWKGIDQALGALGRGALLVGSDLRIQRASSVVGQLLGERPEDLVGRPIVDLIGPDLLDHNSPFRLAIEADERPEGWRVSTRGAAGRLVTYSMSGTRLPGACGPEGYLLVMRVDRAHPPPSAPVLASSEARGQDGETSALPGFAGMIAASAPMLRVFQLVEHLRESDATVLVTGESGTGKELVARAIHAHSPRAHRPFVAINCAALPSELLETELFGHVRGAFTGAVRDKVGRFEVAADGTIFLDEIGDLPLPLQVKLLRVLQERVFERVGDTATRPFRARVVAATHHNLADAVSARRFREDLYYRLNVVHVHLPPLRERREDLELLVTHLVSKIAQQHGRTLFLSEGALRALLAQDWPGNVRQLENALEFAATMCSGSTIHVTDLPPEIARAATPSMPPPAPVSERPPSSNPGLPLAVLEPYPSASQIAAALEKCRHRRAEAAKLLGVSRTTLWRRLREISLDGKGTP